MEFKDYLAIARRWWWLTVVGIAIGAGIGYVIYQPEVPLYQATTTLMIGNFVKGSYGYASEGDIAQSKNFAQSYQQLIKREPVLSPTVKALNLDIPWTSLRGSVSASLVPNTQLFEVQATSRDPIQAKLIADEVANQLIHLSPSASDKERDVTLKFVEFQVVDLEEKINNIHQQVMELEASKDLETTRQGEQKREEKIKELQAQLTEWQSTYASLLSHVEDMNPNNLILLESATIPTQPYNIKTPMDNVLMGASIGLSVAIAIIFLFEFLDDTVKGGEDINELIGVPLLGTIFYIGADGKRTLRPNFPRLFFWQNGRNAPKTDPASKLVVDQDFFSPIAEAYRVLRTNIQFSKVTNPSPIILITSSSLGEGKSTTAANLAMVMAQAGKRVVLIDADLRRPNMHNFFGLSNDVGLTDVLIDDISVEDALIKVGEDDLQILTSGGIPPNPAELVGSPQMETLLHKLEEQNDTIIIDSPPLLAVTDASLLSAKVGGTILVVDVGRTRREACQRSKVIVDRVGGNMMGVVLNKLNPRKARGGYNYYYYNYYYTSSNENGRTRHKKRTKRTTSKKESQVTSAD